MPEEIIEAFKRLRDFAAQSGVPEAEEDLQLIEEYAEKEKGEAT